MVFVGRFDGQPVSMVVGGFQASSSDTMSVTHLGNSRVTGFIVWHVWFHVSTETRDLGEEHHRPGTGLGDERRRHEKTITRVDELASR